MCLTPNIDMNISGSITGIEGVTRENDRIKVILEEYS